MIRDIVTDVDFLKQQSCKVTKADDTKALIQDLLDTAQSYGDKCAGLTAIQIGEPKRICVINDAPDHWLLLINPVIVARSNTTHMSTEGCLSLEGTQTVKRHNQITIMSEIKGKMKKQSFGGFTAVVIQHELDHMNGIVI